MVSLKSLTIFALLSFTISAAPANDTISELTLDDIINAPFNPPPVADPAFVPIVATSNDTLVEGNPAAQAKVDNVASVLSSITAAGPSATDVVQTPAPTVNSKVKKMRRGGGPGSPPPTPNYVSNSVLIIFI